MFDRGEAVRKLVLNMARLSGLAPLARRFGGGIGAILMLHRVTNEGKPLGINRHLSITPEFLDAVLSEMKRLGYRFVSMDEAVDRIRSGRTAERFAALTLDDAYRDNLTEALPVFEKHQTPFTIYVAPALLEGTIDLWWETLENVVTQSDRIAFEAVGERIVLDCSTPARKIAAARRIHEHLVETVSEQEQQEFMRGLAGYASLEGGRDQPALMNWEEIRGMAAHPLGTIGAHTVHHYNLARLSVEAARSELVDGARIIEERIGEKPRHLAYPYGYVSAVGAREVELAREAGYVSAVTTRHGVLRPGHADHLHALPRISVNGRYQRLGHIRTMLSGITTPLANRGKRLVTI